GCSRIAFVNSLAGTPSLLKREADFLAAAQKVGVTVQVEQFGTTSYESGQILAQRLLTRKVRPDAVYCATDLLACGFMDEARHRFALRIPDDLCLIGHDNIAQSGWASYNLTTFAQPVEQFARDAIAWLVETEAQPETLMPKNEQQQERRIYPVDVVWRGSVRGG
ncbi:substrate-binding domain-containing protein, partial [Pantoea agglomerans]